MSGRIISRQDQADLTANSFDVDFNFENACRLLTVYIHASTNLTENITVTFKSGRGANYNTVIATRLLDTESDYVYSANGMVAVNEIDSVNVSVTNANNTGSVYVTVKAETDY